MKLSQSILATLAYHDIFDYPLKLEEIHKYLVGKKASLRLINKQLNNLIKSKKIIANSLSSNMLYALKNRRKLFGLRKLKEKYSGKKLKKAKYYANLLKLIPLLKMVAISGALAMNNSQKSDDIDLILISKEGTLWTTRFFSNLVLVPYRRWPKSQKKSDKACLNIFLESPKFKIKDQNIYTAHEICQLKPLWDRDNTYQKFAKTNSWVKKYLPNWQPESAYRLTPNDKGKKNRALDFSRLALVVKKFLVKLSPLEAFLIRVALWAEWIAKWGQLRYMQSKITTEKIDKHQLFFHPSDTKEQVLTKYQKRIKKLDNA